MTAMFIRVARCVVSIAFVGFAACQSSSTQIARLYTDLAHEVANADPVRMPAEDADAIHVKRADQVRDIVEHQGVSTREDTFKAAVILVGTNRPKDLEMAETLARRSAQLGEVHGLRVAAEAIDKRAMVAGKPQKYGTQYVFEWVLDSWRLYPIDLTTTDADRAAMGVPSYGELLASEDAMNVAHGKKTRAH